MKISSFSDKGYVQSCTISDATCREIASCIFTNQLSDTYHRFFSEEDAGNRMHTYIVFIFSRMLSLPLLCGSLIANLNIRLMSLDDQQQEIASY